MNTSGLRASPSALGLVFRLFRLICLSACLLLAGDPAVADTTAPSSTRGVYVPAPSVKVPDLRQRPLPEAQKIATEARLRLQVSGEPPADPSKVVVAEQKPEPNAIVPAGTTVTVVVRAPAARQTGPTRQVIAPKPLTAVPELLKRSLSEAQPLVAGARLKLEVSGGAPEDARRAIVVQQKPPSGTRVVVGTTVVVTVQIQRTEEGVIVPELRSRLLPDAQRLVNAVRLRLEVSGGAPGDTSRATVVDQKPPPGTRARAGTTVVVTVQTQRTVEGVLVPDVRRQLLLEAQRHVTSAQLRLEVAGGWPAEPSLAMVVEQKPRPDTRVPLNSVVVVVVQNLPGQPQPAMPPAPVQPPIVSPPLAVSPPQIAAPPEVPPPDEWVLVPAVRERPLMDALQRVRNARLRLEVTGGWPADPARAVVVEQTPEQDTRVRIGTSVRVQVSPAGQALQPSPAPPQPAAPPPQLTAPPPQLTAPLPTPAQLPASPPPAPPAQPPRVEMTIVPELRQQSLPDARELTRSARLELRVQGQSPADETRAVVVAQRPPARARAAIGSSVLVELGAALLEVPELRKHPLDEARQILDEAGFGIALMGDAPSNETRAQVVEQTPLPGARAAAGSIVTVRVTVSRLLTWVLAGAGALLAAGAALGIARWRGVGSQSAAGLTGVRVIASGDAGTQRIRSSGAAVEGFAIRLRGRSDAGTQAVEAGARIVAEEQRADG